MRQFSIFLLLVSCSALFPSKVHSRQTAIELKPGPVLATTEVAKLEIAFVDLNNDKRPDLVVGSQCHVFDEDESKFSRTKMTVDGNPISIHLNRSTRDQVKFSAPHWPVSNRDKLCRLPAG